MAQEYFNPQDNEVLQKAQYYPLDGGVLTDLTREINSIPNMFGVVSNLGIFENEGITTTTFRVDVTEDRLGMLPQISRGDDLTRTRKEIKRTLAFPVPYYGVVDRLTPEDLQDQRRPGAIGPDKAARKRAKLLVKLRKMHAQTLEYSRMSAIKGVVRDGAGNEIVDLFSANAFDLEMRAVDNAGNEIGGYHHRMKQFTLNHPDAFDALTSDNTAVSGVTTSSGKYVESGTVVPEYLRGKPALIGDINFGAQDINPDDVPGTDPVSPNTGRYANADYKLMPALNRIKRYSELNVFSGDTITGYTILCAPSFFDKLITHPAVVEAYKYYAARQQVLKSDTRRGFEFGGLNFQEYNGSVKLAGSGTVEPFVEDDTAYLIPRGIDDMFFTVCSPANHMDYVNTTGVEIYNFSFKDPRGRYEEFSSESSTMPFCTRPQALVKIVWANTAAS